MPTEEREKRHEYKEGQPESFATPSGPAAETSSPASSATTWQPTIRIPSASLRQRSAPSCCWSGYYFCNVVLGNADLMAPLTVAGVIPAIIINFFVTPLTDKFGVRFALAAAVVDFGEWKFGIRSEV